MDLGRLTASKILPGRKLRSRKFEWAWDRPGVCWVLGAEPTARRDAPEEAAMLDATATPFASLLGLFIAVPLSLIVGVYLGEGVAALRAHRVQTKPSRSAQTAAVVERSPNPRGSDPGLGVVWG